ncbi:MAG TPA: DUF6782 family putative metallopeptidase [Mycobacteriales bacterium]|nr:DUF6782 family putative metallopeptidase [Mycobacteriales bacterium]
MTAYWPAPEPLPRGPRGRRATWLAAIAVLDVVALLAGAGSYAVRRESARPPEARDIRALVPELSEFVEEARGLRFRTPVDVTLLDDEEFRARLLAEDEAEEDDAGAPEAAEPEPEAGVTLQALGLVEPGLDLDSAVESLTGDTVAGFYDAETKELVVRGDEATPLVRAVLVHELTHALQDQHFELDRPDLEDRDDEAFLGYLGLVEGDASVVEDAYRDQLSSDERGEMAQEEQELYGDAAADVPDVLLALFGFPYEAGPEFVRALRDARGQAGLDAAFERPPSSSEHLLHIASYLAGDQPQPVGAPRARGAVVDHGVLGELGLLLTLAVGGDRDYADVFDEVDDWAGDRYVSWREGTLACTSAAIVMDDATAAAELRAALQRWAADRARTSVAGSGPRVTLDACA